MTSFEIHVFGDGVNRAVHFVDSQVVFDNLSDYAICDVEICVAQSRIFSGHLSLFVVYSQLVDAIVEALLIKDHEAVLMGNFEPIARLRRNDEGFIFCGFDPSDTQVLVTFHQVSDEVQKVGRILVDFLVNHRSNVRLQELLSRDSTTGIKLLEIAYQANGK